MTTLPCTTLTGRAYPVRPVAGPEPVTGWSPTQNRMAASVGSCAKGAGTGTRDPDHDAGVGGDMEHIDGSGPSARRWRGNDQARRFAVEDGLVCTWTVEADEYNTAMRLFYDHKGWGRYKPMEE